MVFFGIIIYSILSVVLCVTIYIGIKNENTFKKRGTIIDAIYEYCRDSINKENFNYREVVYYDDMESYERTWLRLYDWGYTRILPKEKYEIIKPYIKESVK